MLRTDDSEYEWARVIRRHEGFPISDELVLVSMPVMSSSQIIPAAVVEAV